MKTPAPLAAADRPSPSLTIFLLGGLVLFQTLKTLFLFRGVDLSLPVPVLNVDFAIYYARALRVHELMALSGRTWGYDPFHMAGYPFTTSCVTAGHLLALLPHLMSPVLSIGRSLLLLEFLALWSFPFLAGLAVFAWSGDKKSAWAMVAVVSLCHWTVEPISRLFISKGLLPFQMAVFGSLCQAAFFWRWARETTWRNWAVQTLWTLLVPMTHPAALVLMFFPCAVLTAARMLRPPKWFVVQGLLTAALAVAANWAWLAPTEAFWPWTSTTDYLKGFGLNKLFGFYGVWGPTGMEKFSSAVNLLLLAAGAGALCRLGRTQKRQAAFFALWPLFFLFIVGAGKIAGMESLQPFRYVMPFWIVIYGLASTEIARRLETPKIGEALVLSAVLFGGFLAVRAVREGPSLPKFVNEWPEDQRALLRRVESEPVPGRWLMECRELGDPHVQEYLAFRARRPLLGGPLGSSFLISKFTLFVTADQPVIFERLLKDMTEKEFKKYLRLYNVSMIAVTSPQAAALLGNFKNILAERPPAGGNRIFQVLGPSSWFAEGTGEAEAGMDRIDVRNASSGALVLKFHWISTLKTEPPLPVGPMHLMDDPVPFIRIDNRRGADRIRVFNGGFYERH